MIYVEKSECKRCGTISDRRVDVAGDYDPPDTIHTTADCKVCTSPAYKRLEARVCKRHMAFSLTESCMACGQSYAQHPQSDVALKLPLNPQWDGCRECGYQLPRHAYGCPNYAQKEVLPAARVPAQS